ncbi:hypothetical protein ACJX0J_018094 [Zea mays]
MIFDIKEGQVSTNMNIVYIFGATPKFLCWSKVLVTFDRSNHPNNVASILISNLETTEVDRDEEYIMENSTFGLLFGYYQIPLKEEDQIKSDARDILHPIRIGHEINMNISHGSIFDGHKSLIYFLLMFMYYRASQVLLGLRGITLLIFCLVIRQMGDRPVYKKAAHLATSKAFDDQHQTLTGIAYVLINFVGDCLRMEDGTKFFLRYLLNINI